ncbi:GNAT family N-acetyltransferase [Agromyces sp. NPDC058136]|uniref:GNAT family N-acetyltransferase n=1 Tax=Agromyces sp. NPDC058136 TaxID=3346354 RepID=UPI0036D82A9C
MSAPDLVDTSMITFLLENRLPTPTEHRRLAEAVGWHEAFDWATMPGSLAGSTLGVVASVGSRAVGMVRVVGDGVKYFYIQDVAVDPEYQRAGIGRAMLRRTLDLIADRAPSPAFVGLFATADGAALYESFGFSQGDMTGLALIVAPTSE